MKKVNQKYFALYDDYAVWGIGSSFREAVNDFKRESKYEADEWAEKLGKTINTITLNDLRSGDGVFGEMRLIKLTPEAYNDLLQNGWVSEKRLKQLNGRFGTDAVWSTNDSTMRGHHFKPSKKYAPAVRVNFRKML